MGASGPLERVADPRAFKLDSERLEYLSDEDFEVFGKGSRKYSPRFARSELQALGSSCLSDYGPHPLCAPGDRRDTKVEMAEKWGQKDEYSNFSALNFSAIPLADSHLRSSIPCWLRLCRAGPLWLLVFSALFFRPRQRPKFKILQFQIEQLFLQLLQRVT